MFSYILLQALSLNRPLEIGKSNNTLYLFSRPCNNKSNASVSPTNTVTHTCSISSSPSFFTFIPNSISTVSLASGSKTHDSSVNVRDPAHLCIHVNLLNTNNNDVRYVCPTSLHQKDIVNLLWHNRLGHVPFVKIKGIPSIPATLSSNNRLSVPFSQWQGKQDCPFQKKSTPRPKYLSCYMLVYGVNTTLQLMITISTSLPL